MLTLGGLDLQLLGMVATCTIPLLLDSPERLLISAGKTSEQEGF